MAVALPSFQAASLHVADGVAEFVHERPQARNPLGTELRQDYLHLLDWLEADDGVRVLVLRGADGCFSAGGDVREMVARLDDPQAHTAERTRARIEAANAWLQRLLVLDKVVIAAVDGPAFGGGFSLALHADLVLATPRARFCMSFARVGAVPDFGAHYLLPRVVGLGAARDLLLTARSIGAKRAQQLGIVHAIHPPGELTARAIELARRFTDGPHEVFAATKRMLRRSLHDDYATMGTLEAQAQGTAMAAPYHHDAARRFRGKDALAFDWDRDGAANGFPAES
jgi:2-(1,2-epoxy-1,2-dihydrophenyl)acetyl-CoA isomerase